MNVIEMPRPTEAASVLAPVSDEVADTSLTTEQLASRIVGMAGRLASAMCRWLLLVAEFDARDGAWEFLVPSTARWLSHYCGLSHRTAVEHLRVARALATHPPLAEAMTAGRISFSHARAIARAADLGDPALVEDLVMVAEHGTVRHLENIVRGLRTVDRNRAVDPESAETVSHRWRDDSYLGLSAKLDPEHGALVLSGIDAVARREGITHAMALTRLAEIGLTTLNSSAAPAPTLRGDEYAAIVVHLDAAKMPAEQQSESQPAVEAGSRERDVAPEPIPYARIANGPGLPDATVQRLLCTGRIRAVVTAEHPEDGETDTAELRTPRYRWRKGVLDVGANRRLVSDKTFRALLIRDGGCCTVPGCGSTNGLEAHHVQHWIHGGKTIMRNLTLLCRAHHHALHDGAFSIIAAGNERFRFYLADGREIPQRVDRGALADGAAIEDGHDDVAPTAATTRWDGSKLNLDWAIAVLAQRLPRADRSNPRRQPSPPVSYEDWIVSSETAPLIA